MPVNYKNWLQENADAKKEIAELKSTQKNSIKKSFGKVANKISKDKTERERKNFEKMNELRYNSAYLSDALLRTFINDTLLDKFERIGYAAAFADRYSDRNR